MPDKKYIPKGKVPVGFIIDVDLVEYVEAFRKRYKMGKSECANYMLREFRRVMGEPAPFPPPPSLPEGSILTPSKRRKRKSGPA